MEKALKMQIIISYIVCIIGTIIFVIIFIKLYNSIFKKKYLVKIENVFPTKKLIVEKYLIVFENVIRVFLILMIVFFIPNISRHIREIPNVIGWKTIAKIVVSKSSDTHNDNWQLRSALFEDDQGNKYNLRVQSLPIYSNKCYEVEFFNYLKLGQIKDEIDCNSSN